MNPRDMTSCSATPNPRFWKLRRWIKWNLTEPTAKFLFFKIARHFPEIAYRPRWLWKFTSGIKDGLWCHVCGDSIMGSLRIAWIWWKP